MDGEQLLAKTLDIGVEMLKNGAETHKTEETLYRICESYGFKDCNFWVVPTNIQATVTDPEGRMHTQIRYVRKLGTDYSKMADINNLSRVICTEKPNVTEIEKRLKDILDRKPQPLWLQCLAGVLGGTFFGVFFNCDFFDALVAAIVSLIASLLAHALQKHEGNPMIFNFIISFICEFIIIICVHIGFGHHIGYITIGMVMLLISGLGITNGIRDIMHLDTISGVLRIASSLLGAVGLAAGIGVPMLILRQWTVNEEMMLNPDIFISLLSAALGCLGFALWFNVKSRHLALAVLGALITWGVYLLVYSFYPGYFIAVAAASTVCAAYAQVAARIIKAPAPIFLSIAIFPVVPGASLYYMMYGLVTQDFELALEKFVVLMATCFAIVVGIMVVEVAVKCIKKGRGALNP